MKVLFAIAALALFDRAAAIGSASFIDPTRDQTSKSFGACTSSMCHPVALVAIGAALAGTRLWWRLRAA